ncbi:hypothetical protein AJ78_08809 [Emergomyces pasteurianus Ep9510]|uniref:Protein kinase domain-containing protein n=1 Tax=Emergomyces pasteurianus Ep9510 TaxID=1447872 RepID=A0A1J9PQ75_9EURO|nr:hypothetical protein AJ78_08809 [Emergomyces pasteurianus Ep9510]
MGLWPRHSVTEFCNFSDSPVILEEYLRFAKAIETDGSPDGLQNWALLPFLPLFSDTEFALLARKMQFSHPKRKYSWTHRRAAIGPEAATSSSVGLVRDDKSSRCLGLLLSWLECRRMTLESALRSNASFALRQKWAGQLTATLNHLHRGGEIWGDAKPANVLIDVNNDLWVIDFGGGYSQGRVEKEKARPIDGDNEGLLKIRNLLFQQS